MRLFDRGDVCDVVLGVGLIGGAVCDAIARLPGPPARRTLAMPHQWERASLVEALARAEVWLGTEKPAARVRVFWCAGRGGFATNASMLEGEREAFARVLEWAEALSASRAVELHLTSSAGGLHEGQLRVTDASAALATRPYGQLKLEQEALLQHSRLRAKFIYRPASVYGVPRHGNRLGMIPTLVLNAVRRLPTTVTAHSSTLRDYVFAGDVGAYIASDGRAPGLSYLVSGRPLSIFGLMAEVQRYLQRRPLVVFSTSKDNQASITFAPSLKPADFHPSAFESNVARLVSAVQARPRVA